MRPQLTSFTVVSTMHAELVSARRRSSQSMSLSICSKQRRNAMFSVAFCNVKGAPSEDRGEGGRIQSSFFCRVESAHSASAFLKPGIDALSVNRVPVERRLPLFPQCVGLGISILEGRTRSATAPQPSYTRTGTVVTRIPRQPRTRVRDVSVGRVRPFRKMAHAIPAP